MDEVKQNEVRINSIILIIIEIICVDSNESFKHLIPSFVTCTQLSRNREHSLCTLTKWIMYAPLLLNHILGRLYTFIRRLCTKQWQRPWPVRIQFSLVHSLWGRSDPGDGFSHTLSTRYPSRCRTDIIPSTFQVDGVWGNVLILHLYFSSLAERWYEFEPWYWDPVLVLLQLPKSTK